MALYKQCNKGLLLKSGPSGMLSKDGVFEFTVGCSVQ